MAVLQKDEQIATLHRALELVTDFSCAIDAGACYGEWTRVMAGRFAHVHAFEPNAALFAKLDDNGIRGLPNVTVHFGAVWCRNELVMLNEFPGHPEKVRGKFISPGGDIPAVKLDTLQLPTLGLLKLDCEGADFHALQGAYKTMRRCHPVVIVEVKRQALERFGAEPRAIENLMRQIGASEQFRMGPDRVYAWRK
jgi:FkbM family methyltransferase